MDDLRIEIDFKTAQAIAGAIAFNQTLDQATTSVEKADTAITRTESSLATLGEVAGTAATQLTKTGSAAAAVASDATKVATASEQAAGAIGKAADAATTQARAADSASDNLVKLREAEDEAAAAAKQMGLSAELAAGELENLYGTSEKARSAEKELAWQATAAATAEQALADATTATATSARAATPQVEGLATATGNVGTASTAAKTSTTSWLGTAGVAGGTYFVVREIIKLLEDLEAQTRKVIEAEESLGGKKLAFDQTILPLALNLGFNTDEAGLQKTRQLALQFMKQTGATPEQAREELATAQSAGVDVRDSAGGGFGAAVEAGKFAARQGLKADTAGQLVKLAAATGVKDREGMKEFLAQMEAAFQNVAISNPTEFYAAAVKSMAGRVAQKVPFDQAAAQVAASALFEPDPSTAAIDVGTFSRVASGARMVHAKELGKALLNRGVITQVQLDEETAKVRPEVEKEAEAVNDREAERKVKQDRRELPEFIRHAEEEVQIEEAKARKAHGPGAAGAREAARHAREELADKIQSQKDKVQAMEDQLQARRDDREKKIEALALGKLARNLNRGVEEQALYDMTEGMDEQQISEFIAPLTQGTERDAIMPQLLKKGREARAAALKGIRAATVAGLDDRNQRFRDSSVSQAQQAQVARTESELEGTDPGETFANEVMKAADARAEIMRSQGKGGDFGQSVRFREMTYAAPWGDKSKEESDRYAWANAPSEEGLRAKRAVDVTKEGFERFVAGLTPEQRQTYDASIQQTRTELSQARDQAILGDVPGRGAAALNQVRQTVKRWAERRQTIQQKEADLGHQMPAGDEPGGSVSPSPGVGFAAPAPPPEADKWAAANELGHQAFAAPAGSPERAALYHAWRQKLAATGPMVEQDGSPFNPDATEEEGDKHNHKPPATAPTAAPLPPSPHASAAHHHVTYNQYIGNHWAGPADDGDLPGRYDGMFG